MYVVPDPRTEEFARITADKCLIICNSDLAWSVAAASTYAAARGVPVGNIVQMALGTGTIWDPGANSVYLDFATTVKNAWLAKNARAVLIAPGCPHRVRVRGVASPGGYNASATGTPPLGHLVMGSPSLNSIINEDVILSCREEGSGNWRWWTYGTGSGSTYEIWNARVAWRLGLSDDRGRVEPAYEHTDLRPFDGAPPTFATGSLPTPLATTYFGWPGSRVIPAGRIGWGAWRLPDASFHETEDNWDGPLNSSIAADALTGQPGRILISLNNTSSSQSMERWAGIAKACADWGYDTEYFYRASSIPSAVQALCPVADAAWTKAEFEGGDIVGEPYYLFGGDSLNADDPVRLEPFKSALAPLDGAAIVEKGASYAFEWGIRGLQTGAAAASMDVAHRVSGNQIVAWVSLWQALRGMNGIEDANVSVGTAFPSGDPLHRPFHFDPAASVPLFGGVDPPIPPPEPPPPAPPVLGRGPMSDRFRERRGRGFRW